MSKTKKICKSCLTEDYEMINILLAYDNDSNIKFSEQYFLCTDIEVQLYDGLPNSLCRKCLIELNNAYNFKIRSQKSDEILRGKCTKISKPLDETTPNDETSQNSFLFFDDLDESNISYDFTESYQSVSGQRTPNKLESSNGEENILADEDFNEEEYEILYETDTDLSKSMPDEDTLEPDLVENKGLKPIKCEHCDKSYFSKGGFYAHLQTHKPGYKPPSAEYLCSTCGRSYTSSTKLRLHSYVHTGEKKFACDLCSKAFQTKFRLQAHRRSHTGEKPYKCDVCGSGFARSNSLAGHKRVHTGERPYECKICFKRFSQLNILRTHMFLHTGKTIECPDCDKMFCRISQLKVHRREHTGEKPYVCTMCPNRYRQKTHLNSHMSVHNGIKYECPICQKSFMRKYTLNTHMYTHKDDRPYKCSKCPMKFIRKDNYTAHQTAHEKPAKKLMNIESLDSGFVKQEINS